MSLFQKLSKKASSRQQIAIDGIRDDVLLLPGGRYRMIIEVSSVNFELKSDEEQDALIDMYKSFLNSLAGPIQILIRVREMEIKSYLDALSYRTHQGTEEWQREQIAAYGEFMRGLITTNRILTRRFYVIVPYTGEATKEFELIYEQLALTADIVAKGLAKLGVQSKRLRSLEVLDLFYSFYDPETAKVQPMTNRTMQLLKESYL